MNRTQRRSRHQRQPASTKVRCVGGPFDGQSANLVLRKENLQLAQEADDGSKAICHYERKVSRAGTEYHYTGRCEAVDEAELMASAE